MKPRVKMQTAKIFTTGRSQAVRLPKEFRFVETEVFIRKEGSDIILSPKPISWKDFFENPLCASEEFLQDRMDSVPQKRKIFE